MRCDELYKVKMLLLVVDESVNSAALLETTTKLVILRPTARDSLHHDCGSD